MNLHFLVDKGIFLCRLKENIYLPQVAKFLGVIGTPPPIPHLDGRAVSLLISDLVVSTLCEIFSCPVTE